MKCGIKERRKKKKEWYILRAMCHDHLDKYDSNKVDQCKFYVCETKYKCLIMKNLSFGCKLILFFKTKSCFHIPSISTRHNKVDVKYSYIQYKTKNNTHISPNSFLC